MRPLLRLFLLLAGLAQALPAMATEPHFQSPWPSDPGVAGTAVAFPTASPFALTDVGTAPRIRSVATLFLPPAATADAPVPAVVILHGAGGVGRDRELTYGAQFAAQGVAALVIDSFAARRDLGRGFLERIMNITEVMLLADAYAGLHYLAARPDIDGRRIAVVGYSYGAMASVLAAYEQVAELFSPQGPRFAAHVGFYGPCIVRLREPATTGAPVLLLWGGRDELIDAEQCELVADDLRGGGSRVQTLVYPDAYHQWDGGRASPWRAGRTLAPCRFRVDPDGTAWDVVNGIPMLDPSLRQASLGLCTSTQGYLIGRDDAVRAQSNAALAAFLEAVFGDGG